MKSYINANLTDDPRITVKYFLKTIASQYANFLASFNEFSAPKQ